MSKAKLAIHGAMMKLKESMKVCLDRKLCSLMLFLGVFSHWISLKTS